MSNEALNFFLISQLKLFSYSLLREHLKIGSGLACRAESQRSIGQVMEAVIMISESSEPHSPCFRGCCPKTEVCLMLFMSPITYSRSKNMPLIVNFMIKPSKFWVKARALSCNFVGKLPGLPVLLGC